MRREGDACAPALTAEIMGHKSARMLYKHYRDVIKNDEDVGRRQWGIRQKQIG